MQPYGNDNFSDQKGLFTFYRQQDEFDKQRKFKSNAQNLKKLLNKSSKANQTQRKKQSDQEGNQIILNSQKHNKKLQEISQEKKLTVLNKRQLKVQKAVVVDSQEGIKPESEIIQKQQKQTKLLTKKDRKLLIGSSSMDLPDNFSKYLSELDLVRIDNKRNFAAQTSPLSERFEEPSSHRVLKIKRDQKKLKRLIQENQKSKVNLHFKKLALQPKQFEGLSDSITKNFVPISIQKREKTALKSYRKQKLKAMVQKDEKHNKFSYRNQATNFQSYQQNPNDNKLIRVQRLQNKPLQNQNQNRSQNFLPKLKINIPQVQNKNFSQKDSSLSFQLLRNSQLKSKYKLRSLERHNQNILFIKEKMRNDIISLKNSPKHLKHYISLRSDQPAMEQSNIKHFQNQIKSQNTHLQPLNCNQLKSDREKQIFCKRNQYLQNYSKIMKRNIFAIQKEEQNQIKAVMEQKKQEIIQNLIQNLNFK